MFNLIVEGIDRVGKSTIVNALDTGEYSRIKMGPPETISRTFYQYLVYFDKLTRCNNTRPLLYDRGHLSDQVYGKLYRSEWYKDDILWSWFCRMEAFLIRCQNDFRIGPTVIVYVEPYNFSVMQQDERPNANRQAELGMYEYIFACITKLPVIRIRSTNDNGWRPVEEIVTELKEKLTHV